MSFLYLKADDALPFGNWQGMVPFSYLLECPDMPKDVRYQLSNRVEQISVTMTGSDSVEVKAVLDFDVFLRKEVPMQVNVRSVSGGNRPGGTGEKTGDRRVYGKIRG